MHLLKKLKAIVPGQTGSKSLFVTNRLFPIDRAMATNSIECLQQIEIDSQIGPVAAVLPEGQRQKSIASLVESGEAEDNWFEGYLYEDSIVHLFEDSIVQCHIDNGSGMAIQTFCVYAPTTHNAQRDVFSSLKSDNAETSLPLEAIVSSTPIVSVPSKVKATGKLVYKNQRPVPPTFAQYRTNNKASLQLPFVYMADAPKKASSDTIADSITVLPETTTQKLSFSVLSTTTAKIVSRSSVTSEPEQLQRTKVFLNEAKSSPTEEIKKLTLNVSDLSAVSISFKQILANNETQIATQKQSILNAFASLPETVSKLVYNLALTRAPLFSYVNVPEQLPQPYKLSLQQYLSVLPVVEMKTLNVLSLLSVVSHNRYRVMRNVTSVVDKMVFSHLDYLSPKNDVYVSFDSEFVINTQAAYFDKLFTFDEKYQTYSVKAPLYNSPIPIPLKERVVLSFISYVERKYDNFLSHADVNSENIVAEPIAVMPLSARYLSQKGFTPLKHIHSVDGWHAFIAERQAKHYLVLHNQHKVFLVQNFDPANNWLVKASSSIIATSGIKVMSVQVNDWHGLIQLDTDKASLRLSHAVAS